MSLRIDQLIEFIKDDPHDPFNHYALALEYRKANEQRALEIFEDLIKNHPQYIPVYYQLAGLYVHFGEREKAVQTFRDGIAIARQHGDHKTLRELDAGLQELLESED
jgi:Tfp pilus assembly protein PilF